MVEPSSIVITSCTGNSASGIITAVLGSELSSGTFFQIDIDEFTNPPSTVTTSTFEFETFSSSGISLDIRTTSIFLTATAGVLAGADLSTSDPTVAETNVLTVSLTTSHVLTAGGFIEVIMPKWNPNADLESEILPMIQGSYVCSAINNLESTIS